MFKSEVTWRVFTHYKSASVIAHARSCSLHRKRSTQHLHLWKDTGEITNCLFLWRRENGPSSKMHAVLGPPQGTLFCYKWGLGFPECYVCDFSSLCSFKCFHYTKCGQRRSTVVLILGFACSKSRKQNPSINSSLYPTPQLNIGNELIISRTHFRSEDIFSGCCVIIYIAIHPTLTVIH